MSAYQPSAPCPSCGTTEMHDDNAGFGMLGCLNEAAYRAKQGATESHAYMEYGVRWKDGAVEVCDDSLAAGARLQDAKDAVWEQVEGWQDYLGAEVVRRRVEIEKSAWEAS